MKDCLIDDLELLDSKKHLMERMTPLALVHQLKQKHQAEIDIAINDH